MPTAVQPGSAQPVPLTHSDGPSSTALSWEGEEMFNIYIYDYCSKRGFKKTAQELMLEAELTPDSAPPINARQGLLFEWWSVFWTLFTAQSSGSGSEDAVLYTQHQAQQLLQRQRLVASGQSLPLGPQLPMQQHQPQSSVGRLNGAPPRPGPGMPFAPNGPIPNGVGPPQVSMQPGGLNTFSISGVGPTPNGIPGQHGPPPSGTIPTNQPPNYQSLLQIQRPLGGGIPQQQPQPPQQRGPNGPFQSPNMANSPQNLPNQQHPQHQPQQPHPQPPMGQLGGPSPHLSHMTRGGMPPPNQGMNPNLQHGPPGRGNVPPSSQYPQAGQSSSRSATPSQGQVGMMNPSPSLATRQPPGAGAQMMQGDLNNQLMTIPNATLQQIKLELGMDGKDFSTFTTQDKQRILTTYRTRQQKPGGGPPDNAIAGPSNMTQLSNQQRNQQPQRNPQPQPPQQQQRQKRSSTSPGDEHEALPRNDASPPDRKRLRRSPMDQSAAQSMSYPQPPQQHPPQPGIPQSVMMGSGQQAMIVRGGAPMIGMNGGPQHTGQPSMGGPMNLGGMGMGNVGQQSIGMPQMGGMNPQMGPPGAMTPHMQNQQMQAREQLFRTQMIKQQSAGMGNMAGNAGSPASGDPTAFNLGGPMGSGPNGGPGFNPGVGSGRLAQKSMMPPPSPAHNGPPKDQNNASGPGGLNSGKNSMSLESPRNPPNTGPNQVPTPNVNGTGPPTPVPSNQQNQNPGGAGPGPQGPVVAVGVGGQSMAPSPSSILGGPPSMATTSMTGQPPLVNPTGIADNIFSSDFINSVASSLDEFDSNLFRPDGDINFERDFGQWFNPDDVGGLDAMK